ncbi:major facilitator superfamily domain-containing protein [Rhexocercosporidium sp. MPI-PUGE-AT-0058]|nr:major facilitator superfamily domain-containing protein [Rhexocercosporidium sp. MPI-PUGE-AT-0058]
MSNEKQTRTDVPVISELLLAYSLFGTWQKRFIVWLVALAAWFSTLSSFIYYPSIPLIVSDLRLSIAQINISITIYMAVSAIAPSITGDASDIYGRRPLYLFTLSLYLLANIGLACQSSFAELLLLRGLQSAGISGAFSIAYGVVADISMLSERGSYVAALSFGITTAPALGPLMGGALSYSLGWRWIFWFLLYYQGPLTAKDNATVVFAGAFLYTTFCCITASLGTLLIYLPFGIGCSFGAIASGKLIDRDYRLTAGLHRLSIDRVRGDDLKTFPIEKARLRGVFAPLIIAVGTVIAFGWAVDRETHLAVPLIIPFISGLVLQSCFNTTNILPVDINPDVPETAQASSKLIRWTMAAISVAFLQHMIERIGVGWTFTFFGCLCSFSGVLFVVERELGMKWRLERL